MKAKEEVFEILRELGTALEQYGQEGFAAAAQSLWAQSISYTCFWAFCMVVTFCASKYYLRKIKLTNDLEENKACASMVATIVSSFFVVICGLGIAHCLPGIIAPEGRLIMQMLEMR